MTLSPKIERRSVSGSGRIAKGDLMLPAVASANQSNQGATAVYPNTPSAADGNHAKHQTPNPNNSRNPQPFLDAGGLRAVAVHKNSTSAL
jgi:hypothetical protein